MLDSLRFVQGAIQRNGITPELEHFRIKDGRIVGFNGYMALSAPIALDLDATPKAVMFHKALQACGEAVSITQTDNGRLRIKSGKFSVLIQCLESEVYEAQPQGEVFDAPPGLAKTFARMLPFIGDDASRPWAMGLSVSGGCYTATNNVILLQIWDGHQLPTFNCPRFAIAEIARLREDPIKIQLCPHSVTFWFEGDRWLRTQLLAADWPIEKMNSILERPCEPFALPEGFFEAVGQLAPFTEGPTSPLYMTAGALRTEPDAADKGASLEMGGLPEAAFILKALQLLEKEIDTIDLDLHPSPCLFFGENSRGALIGMAF